MLFLNIEKKLSPGEAGRLITENLLCRDYIFYRKEGHKEGLHYSEACAAVGALRYATLNQDKEILKRLVARYETMLDEDSELISGGLHVDLSVIGIVPLEIYLITDDKRYLKQGLTFADSQWEKPRKDGLTGQTRWWIDDMYMVGMLQIQAYRATGKMKYADRAARQMVAYLDKLQKENGLFYHGPECPFFWGRGNGWAAVAMAEVLKSLPEKHKLWRDIMRCYKKMFSSLLVFQSDNGMWRQVVDCEHAWDESSCTAMFAYAMAVGVNNGWLEEEMYKRAVKKAWAALAEHIDKDGNVREICVGAGQGKDLEYYLKRPRQCGDFHGQAPVLWLACELLRSEENRGKS